MIFDKVYYGETLDKWIISLAIAVGVFLLSKLLVTLLHNKTKSLAEKKDKQFFQIVAVIFREVKYFFLFALSLYLASFYLDISDSAVIKISMGFVLILLLQVAFWGNGIISEVLNDYKKKSGEENGANVTTYSALAFMARLLLFSILFLLALDNIGVNVTTLIAGLGVGGIAIALAVQNILGDLFASLSIVLDKPFVIGDFIIVGDMLGVVEKIGLKTTRVKSLSGEQIVFANNDLLQSRIRNFKKMQERRVAFTIGVTYQTKYEQLQEIPGIMKKVIESRENTRFDRAHFSSYGNFSLNFEMVYYIGSPDYNEYMDVQQAINLEIFKIFEDKGIVFAYPTQTLFLEKGDTMQAESEIMSVNTPGIKNDDKSGS